MNCAIHPEVASAGYCRTCGKALCEECKRDVRGVIYCEECIAARMQAASAGAGPQAGFVFGVGKDQPPTVVPIASGTPNPVLAALLAFIPGVGAIYNGQFLKGVVHAALFAATVWASDHVNDAFGFFFPVLFFYMVFDAYRTAKARQLGRPLPPDPLGLSGESIGGKEMASDLSKIPMGAMILIGLGLLFLMQTLGLFHFAWVGKLWPLILIALGIRVYMRRHSGAGR